MDEISNLFVIAIALLVLASMWKIFQKAGRKGWEAIIPIYNLFVIQKIINKPWWWVLLMFIPYIGMIWAIWSTNLLAKSFGKNEGFTLGLVFLPFIFYPMLAFSNATYTNPRNKNENDLHNDEVEVEEVTE